MVSMAPLVEKSGELCEELFAVSDSSFPYTSLEVVFTSPLLSCSFDISVLVCRGPGQCVVCRMSWVWWGKSRPHIGNFAHALRF